MFVFFDSPPHYTTTGRIFSELPAKHLATMLTSAPTPFPYGFGSLSVYGNLRAVHLYLLRFILSHHGAYCQYILKKYFVFAYSTEGLALFSYYAQHIFKGSAHVKRGKRVGFIRISRFYCFEYFSVLIGGFLNSSRHGERTLSVGFYLSV